jgi:hypothetical protein
MSAIGMQFVTVACGELVGLKVGVPLAQAVGMEEKDIATITDVGQLRGVVERWNQFAAQHRPLPRLVLFDRGDRTEIMIGSRA